MCLFRKNVLIGCPSWREKDIFLSIELLRDCILDSIKRDTNVTGKSGQKQPYFTLFGTLIFIIMTHMEMWDLLWYQKIFLNHSIGLRANLIAIGNGKSLYRTSGTVIEKMRLLRRLIWQTINIFKAKTVEGNLSERSSHNTKETWMSEWQTHWVMEMLKHLKH